MKCLIIGPKYNGIANVIRIHQKYLEKLGVDVDWFGFKEQIFDFTKIAFESEKILKKIDFSKYDLIDFHIGMYEPEQFLLLALAGRDLSPKILSVHNTYFEIFKKMGFFELQQSINNIIPSFFNAFIFFGEYPQKYFQEKYGKINNTKIYIPPTHINTKVSNKASKLFEQKYSFKKDSYIGIIGYPSKWKDYKLLLESFEYVDKKIKFVFAGPWWDQKIGFRSKKINNVFVKVVPEYFQGSEYTLFIKNSKFGVFPYVDYPTFQGSGTLVNYIWNRKPVIVSDFASLPEYLNGAGIVLKHNNPEDWGDAISFLLKDNILSDFENKISDIREIFSPEVYADKVLSFYKKMLKK